MHHMCAVHGAAVLLVIVWLPYIGHLQICVLASLITHIQGGGLHIGGGHCSITSSAVSGNTAVSMLSVHVCNHISCGYAQRQHAACIV